MAEIPLVGAEDVITKGKKKDVEKKADKVKKPKEKPVRILRIKFYEKISLPCIIEDGKIGHNDIFAVNRGLEELLKELFFNIGHGHHDMQPPPDCIFVEKDHRMVNNYKFIYIDINKNEMTILKKNLEKPTVIYAFNMGEFSILEGKMSFLKETWDVPKITRY